MSGDSSHPRDPQQRPSDPSPARLAIVGATDLERRLLASAAAERPSPELQRRMRGALGLAAAGTTLATAAVAKAGTSAGASSWLAAGAFAVVVAGGVVASLVSTRASEVTPAAAKKVPSAVAQAPAPAETPIPLAPTRARPVAPVRQRAAATDLRGEIALIDAARSAIRAGAPDRALSLLDHYRHSYPRGEFAPEAAVLRIEAVAAAGHSAEARRLARAFLAQHPDSALSDRVARIAATP